MNLPTTLLLLCLAALCVSPESPAFAGEGGGAAGGFLVLLGAIVVFLGGGLLVQQGAKIINRNSASLQPVDLPKNSRNGKRKFSDSDALQDVDVTVFAPPTARPLSNVIVQVVIHTLDHQAEAHLTALSAEPTAARLASIPLTVQLQRHDLIKVSLECGSATVYRPILSFHWNCKVVFFPFEVQLPDEKTDGPIRFKARVSINAVPAGDIIFNIKLSATAVQSLLSPMNEEVHVFRRPFLSYASEDREQVLRAAQLIKALKMECFQDILSLQPGDRWQERLFSEIDKCDLFLLFWSQHARDSEWVISEAEYALLRSKQSIAERRPIEIVPVLLQGPPAIAPPPSLSGIHFDDSLTYIIFAQESLAKINLEKNLRLNLRLDRIGAVLRKYNLLVVFVVIMLIAAILLIER
jgi:TIR domain